MIARPFAFVGLSYVFALVMLGVVGMNVWVLAACAAGCAAAALFLKRLYGRAVYAVCGVSIIAACISFSYAETLVYAPAFDFIGEDLSVTATVTEIEFSRDNTYYILRADEIGGREADCKMRLWLKEPVGAAVGDTVSFVGDIKKIGQTEESHSYYKSNGIFLNVRADGYVSLIKADKHPLGYYAHVARSYAGDALRRFVGGDGGDLAVSMLTGDKSRLDITVNNAFKACGLSHTLAVSGLHMNVIVLALYKLVRLLFKKARRVSALLCIPVALFYVVFSGFSVSAVRACVMITVMLSGVVISRRNDPLNSLGLAALIITLFNPYAVSDWSFMLSFSSTLGIVLFSPVLSSVDKRIKQKIKNKAVSSLVVGVSDALAVSVVATACTMPVMILFVGRISLVFAPANLAVFFAVPVFMVSAVCTVLISLLPFDLPAQAVAFVCRAVGHYLLKVADTLSGALFSSVRVDSFVLTVWLAVILAVSAFAVFLIRDRKRLAVFGTVLVSASLTVTCLVSAFADFGKVNVTAVNVLDGACFIVSKGTSAVMVGCSGDEYVVSNVLDELGVSRLEAVIIPVCTKENDNCADTLSKMYVTDKSVAYMGCDFENLPDGIIRTDNFSYDFHGIRINYYYDSGYDYCTLTTDTKSALFVFGANTPQSLIKDTKADYLFTRAQPPVWINMADYDAVVVSSGGNTFVNSDTVYSTFDNSHFTLSFGKGREYKINSI